MGMVVFLARLGHSLVDKNQKTTPSTICGCIVYSAAILMSLRIQLLILSCVT